MENYDSVPVNEAVGLTAIYIMVALVLACLAWFFYRSVTKAFLIAFALLCYHFFFGTVHDTLKKYFADTFFARYSFILLVSLLVFLVLILWLRRTNSQFPRLVLYLNLLLLILLAIDIVSLGNKMRENSSRSVQINPGMIVCDTCSRPDIHLIILDAYSGNNALKARFDFNNSAFENELRHRNFYVAGDSRSNYNFTPFSIASMLNMRYLDLNMETKGPGNLNYSYQMIRNSEVIKFAEASGYKFYNFSMFDFDRHPAVSSDNFLLTRTRLVTSQTFLSRIWKDIQFNIGTGKWSMRPLAKRIVYEHFHNNNKFARLAVVTAARETSPKFVYTHLMMPHYPYYYDSLGKELPYDSLVEGKQHSKQNYVGYLQYCNKEILRLADSILHVSSSPPVIILAGDHGFRYFQKNEDRKFCFENLLAVFLPSGDYRKFYDSMSLVNLFPVIFNSEFDQGITLQKDSTVYLWE